MVMPSTRSRWSMKHCKIELRAVEARPHCLAFFRCDDLRRALVEKGLQLWGFLAPGTVRFGRVAATRGVLRIGRVHARCAPPGEIGGGLTCGKSRHRSDGVVRRVEGLHVLRI